MRRLLLCVSVVVAATMLGAGTAAAVPPEAPEGFEYVSAKEQVMVGIGCQQDPNNPTCNSTSYWLGQQAGDNSVGNALTFTPLEYIFAATGEEAPFATFTADDTLEPEYVLRSDEPIKGQIQTSGFIGGAEFGADTTVKVVLRATRAGSFQTVDMGTATVNKPVVTPTAEGRTFAFEITLPDTLDGVKIKDLQMDLYFRGVHVLQNGFIDGEGGSFFDLPYYELVPTQ